jgi:hypothetical protein
VKENDNPEVIEKKENEEIIEKKNEQEKIVEKSYFSSNNLRGLNPDVSKLIQGMVEGVNNYDSFYKPSGRSKNKIINKDTSI